MFARLLDEQIPPGALVLEAGCGTAQLTNFLGMDWRRRVIGADLCMNSLRLGKGFRDRFAIVNADFVQMNLFRPPFADASFDLVISNGVLHHTADPQGGYRCDPRQAQARRPHRHRPLQLARPPAHLWRRRLIETFGDRMAALDSRLRGNALNTGRWAAWFRDQYKHPHESKHSMGEVLGWFKSEQRRVRVERALDRRRRVQGRRAAVSSRIAAGSRSRPALERDRDAPVGRKDGGLYIMIGRKVK